MQIENKLFAKSTKRELIITRIFDAPRELVFNAWIDPKQMAKWWGPKNFTNPLCELDPRPGGKIRIDMTGPDGTVYPMKGVFHKISMPQLLVFTSTAFLDEDDNPGLEILNTVTFEQHEGKTKLTLSAVIVKASPEAEVALAGMEGGWNQSLDRLTALCANVRNSQ